MTRGDPLLARDVARTRCRDRRRLLAAAAFTVALALFALPAPARALPLRPLRPDPDDITVRSLTIRGLDAVDPPVELPDRLPLSPGSDYTAVRLEALEAVIEASFAERGHPYAQVEIGATVDPAAAVVDIEVDVDAGPAAVFGPIMIQADPPIRERDVRERLAYTQGEPFRPSAVNETIRRLRALPVTDEVRIEAQGLELGAPIVPTRVVVPAARIQGFEVEGTLSSATCLEVAGYWRNRYLFGAPRALSLGVGFGNLLAGPLDGDFPCTAGSDDQFGRVDYFVDVELRQPVRGDPRTAFGIRGFVARTSVPQAYVREGFGARFTVIRELSPGLDVLAAYSPARSELKAVDVYFCGSFGVCDRGAIDRLAGTSWFSPLELSLAWAPALPPRVLQPPAPEDVRWWIERRRWTGWLDAGLDGAAGFTGSDHRYIRGETEGALTRLAGRFELAGRARAGLIAAAGDVRLPQITFFSGGLQSVRGAAQNLAGPRVLVISADRLPGLGCSLAPLGCPADTRVDDDEVRVQPTGGDRVIEGNLEGRVWLGRRIQLAGFVDAGYLYRGDAPVGPDGAAAPSGEGLWSPGLGVRALTPLGPLRVDVAYDTRGSRRYPLFTEDPETQDLIFLGDVVFDPYTHDSPGRWRELWRRLRFHVGFGQSF